MYKVINELTKEVFTTSDIREAEDKFSEYCNYLTSEEEMSIAPEHGVSLSEVVKRFVPEDMGNEQLALPKEYLEKYLLDELELIKMRSAKGLTPYDIGNAVGIEFALNLLRYPYVREEDIKWQILKTIFVVVATQ